MAVMPLGHAKPKLDSRIFQKVEEILRGKSELRDVKETREMERAPEREDFPAHLVRVLQRGQEAVPRPM